VLLDRIALVLKLEIFLRDDLEAPPGHFSFDDLSPLVRDIARPAGPNIVILTQLGWLLLLTVLLLEGISDVVILLGRQFQLLV
jgi:hypothetical protein